MKNKLKSQLLNDYKVKSYGMEPSKKNNLCFINYILYSWSDTGN